MRILQLSDLHMEFEARTDGWRDFIRQLDPDVDVVALCGDIAVGQMIPHVLAAFAAHFGPDVPVLYVTGNHEYYGSSFDYVHEQCKAACDANPSVHWLNGDVFEHKGQRFLGHALWYLKTDATTNVWMRSAYPGSLGWSDSGGYTWSDFEHIKHSADIFAAGAQAHDFFHANLREEDIVLTHMLPSDECVTERWRGMDTNIFFVHDLTDLIKERKPKLWMYGHTHDSFEVTIGDTKLRSNPRGYWPRMLNEDFDAQLVHKLQV